MIAHLEEPALLVKYTISPPASLRNREVLLSVADLRVAHILQLAGNPLYDGFSRGLANQILDRGAAKDALAS